MFTSPGEIAFSFGNFDIRYYGLIMTIAILSAFFVMIFIAKKYYSENKETLDNMSDMAFWAIIGAIIGARAYYCLFNFDYYSQNLAEILALNKGGMSIHGALIGGLIFGIFWVKKHNLSVLKFMDYASFALPVGQAIGRFGNFFNSEAYGLPTALPWGVYIPLQKRIEPFIAEEFYHPTFLYESIWNVLVFLVLFFIIRKIPKLAVGSLFFVYLILYSIGRFFIELIRIDSILNFGKLPLAAVVSLIIILISVIILFILNKNNLVKKY